MKTLILIRHAKSDQKEYKGKERNRPITKKGEQKVHLLGGHLKARNLIPQRILTSPAKRATQTAEIIRDEIGFEGKIKTLEVLDMAEANELLKVIRKLPEDIDSVLIVGHNPGLESLIPYLTHEIAALPHAGFALLSLSIERWKGVKKTAGAQLVELWDPCTAPEERSQPEVHLELPTPEEPEKIPG